VILAVFLAAYRACDNFNMEQGSASISLSLFSFVVIQIVPVFPFITFTHPANVLSPPSTFLFSLASKNFAVSLCHTRCADFNSFHFATLDALTSIHTFVTLGATFHA